MTDITADYCRTSFGFWTATVTAQGVDPKIVQALTSIWSSTKCAT